MSENAIHASQARVCAAVGGEFRIAAEEVLRIWRRCTELLARENRQQKRIDRDKIIQGLRASSSMLPSPEREQHGTVEFLNVTEARGNRRMVAVDPVQHYLGRGWITPRQARAAGRYRDDHDLGIAGARDPEVTGVSGSRRSSGYGEAQLCAVESYTAVRDRLGPTFVDIVEQVVIYERTVRDLVLARIGIDPAGNKREPTRGESDAMMWLLRAGLDILGDAYGEPAEVVSETIATDPLLRIAYRFEKNGKVSGVTRNGQPWIASARSLGELKQKAHEGGNDAEDGTGAQARA